MNLLYHIAYFLIFTMSATFELFISSGNLILKFRKLSNLLHNSSASPNEFASSGCIVFYILKYQFFII